MGFRFDAILFSNLGNENSDAEHIRCPRGPQVYMVVVHTEKVLFSSKYILLTREVGIQSPRIKSLTSGHDDNVSGMFLIHNSFTGIA